MLIKKFGALLLALTLVVACIPGTFATAEGAVVEPREDGVIVLEAENGTLDSGLTVKTDKPAASNAKYVYSSVVGSIKHNFKLEKDGVYDVWAILGVHKSNGNNFGKIVMNLAGKEIYNKNHKSHTTVGDVLYTAKFPQSFDGSMMWVKVKKTVPITAGSNEIETMIDRSNNTWGLVDVVVLVPADWDWTPENSTTITKPSLIKDRSFGWIEGEDMVPANDDAKKVSTGKYSSGGECSGGSEIYRFVQGSSAESAEFTAAFKVDKAGEYEIWNYGMCYETTQGTHLAHMTASVGSDKTNGSSNDCVLDDVSASNGGYKRWCRLAGDITLEAGWNTLNVKYTAGGNYLFVTDAIAIVPKGWSWRPAAKTDAVVNAPKLDTIAIENIVASQAADVKGNLTLPDRGAAGSTITYVSTNPAITNRGIVTAPSIWDGDATGTIVATATKGTATASTNAISATVRASMMVGFDSFEIVGDIANGGEIYATATNVTKAHDAATTAVVVLAVYKGDTLISVRPSTDVTLTAEGQTLTTATATLPSDVTGVTVKAFLWNGLSTGMPYCLPLSK